MIKEEKGMLETLAILFVYINRIDSTKFKAQDGVVYEGLMFSSATFAVKSREEHRVS